MLSNLRVLIAAAGRGTRSGLPYPKTLYPVNGVPILLRILSLLAPYDSTPTVIVSPAGEQPIDRCLRAADVKAHIVIQPQPLGMGDAVLRFYASPAFVHAEHVLLIWGDLPYVSPETVAQISHTHFEHKNDFTFATRQVESAYTTVLRDNSGQVLEVLETREQGGSEAQPGERDIGLFVFRKAAAFPILSEDLSGKFGSSTGEHGFLYLIRHLVRLGFKVEALKVATESDLISLNRLEDLDMVFGEKQ